MRVCFDVGLPFSNSFLSQGGIFFSWAWGPSSERWKIWLFWNSFAEEGKGRRGEGMGRTYS